MVERGSRYVCGDGKCRWLKKGIAEQYLKENPHWVDCTDMSEDEFLGFLVRGGDKAPPQEK